MVTWDLAGVAAAFVRDVAQQEGLTRKHAQELVHDHGEYHLLLQEFRSAQQLVDAVRLAQFLLPPLAEVQALRSALGFDWDGTRALDHARMVNLSERREAYLQRLQERGERSSFRTLVRQEAAAALLLGETLPKVARLTPDADLIQSLHLGKPV